MSLAHRRFALGLVAGLALALAALTLAARPTTAAAASAFGSSGSTLPGADETVPGLADASNSADLATPHVSVLTNEPGTAPGDVFISPKQDVFDAQLGVPMTNPQGPEILDDQGRPFFVQPVEGEYAATDFRVQEYDGQPVLTYAVGKSSGGPGHSEGEDVILNQHYQQIATVKAGNGLMADQHEFRLTDHGTALITAYKKVPYDLAPYGGSANGSVLDGVVQEIDVATGKVLFEWDSLSHVPLSASYQRVPLPIEGETPWDYFHINSVNPAGEGNLLISSRHTWTVFKVSRKTGAVIWRLGGKESSFKQGPGVHFAWQHNALPETGEPNTIRIFDNGNDTILPTEPWTRILDIHVDPKAGTATLTGEVVHPQHLSVGSQGNAQRLPDGHLFVGWGQTGRFSELDAAGNLLWDAQLPAGYDTYRAYCSPWVGEPLTEPAATATAGLLGGLSVSAIWNGATEVARWEVLAGPTASTLAPVATSAWDGLDTTLSAHAPGAKYVAVIALDGDGNTIGRSPTVSVGG